MPVPPLNENEVARIAADQSGANIFSDFVSFLGATKKWWLVAILVALALLGGLMLMSGSAAAPFIYTLF
jgi:hypothetical protein